MSFDRIAPFYERLEKLVFGSRLQRARVAFAGDLIAPTRVLIVGEGNGRFLEEFIALCPDATVDCVDASEQMLHLAQTRIGSSAVRFIQADILQAQLPHAHYDLLVTHFFLDCFGEEKLPQVITKLAQSATDDAHWLIAEFSRANHGWLRRFGGALVRIMYCFFRIVAGIDGKELLEYGSFLGKEGFHLIKEQTLAGGIIRSQLWSRRP